jgi:hypothetical protein
MAHRSPAILPTTPDAPVYATVRFCKGGPRLPALVWIVDGDRDSVTHDLVSDQRLAYRIGDATPQWADDWWPGRRGYEWPWAPISREQYEYLVQLIGWARVHQPEHPILHPKKPIDKSQAPLE